jgi:glycosyltransferase involved in cell wall biosynthesis
VHVLADRADGAHERFDGPLHVLPCWSFGGVDLPLSVIAAARRLKPDVIWFNLHLTSAGNTRRSRFAGIAAPAAARAAGFRTIVTLHNMLGLTDLSRCGMGVTALDVWGAHAATRMLRAADAVCVLRAEYVELLRTRYGIAHVRYMPHGTLGPPAAAVARSASHDILAFGHFGGYKRLEHLIDAVNDLAADGTAVHLSVGGSDSRYSPGYLDRLQRSPACQRHVTFLGYVPEAQVPAVFGRSALSVLPYATMTGMSGVAIQSAMYGVPIVASDISGFRALADEGLEMTYFDWQNTQNLKHAIRRLLDSPALRQRQAAQNLEYCRGQRMESVVDRYLDLVEDLLPSRRRIPCETITAP